MYICCTLSDISSFIRLQYLVLTRDHAYHTSLRASTSLLGLRQWSDSSLEYFERRGTCATSPVTYKRLISPVVLRQRLLAFIHFTYRPLPHIYSSCPIYVKFRVEYRVPVINGGGNCGAADVSYTDAVGSWSPLDLYRIDTAYVNPLKIYWTDFGVEQREYLCTGSWVLRTALNSDMCIEWDFKLCCAVKGRIQYNEVFV